MLIKLLSYAIIITAIFSFGTIGTYILGRSGNFNVRINSMFTAFYFTVITLSTIGYGDIVPTTEIARAFVIVLVLSGIGTFASAITSFSSDIVGSRIEKLSGRLSKIEKKNLVKHVVLIGYDLTNAIIAAQLKEQGKKFIVITSNKITADKLKEKGYIAYVADQASEEDMKNFRFDSASAIIIDLRDKAQIVYAAIVAKAVSGPSGSDKIIVIAPNIELEKHLNSIGIKNTINPSTIAAEYINKILKRKNPDKTKLKS
ncbi:MAG: ion channel [Candidatus Micrarchaeia archaeon]